MCVTLSHVSLPLSLSFIHSPFPSFFPRPYISSYLYLSYSHSLSELEKELTGDTLVVVGSKSTHVSADETMFSKMDKVTSLSLSL